MPRNEPMSGKAFHEQRHEVAERAFSNHRIVEAQSSPETGRWMLRRPQDSQYWVEVIAVARGVMVHGDINVALFMYCDNQTYEGRVAWMGARPKACSYVAEKFRIGMGDHGWPGWCYSFNRHVALHDIDELIARHDDDKEDWFDSGTSYQLRWTRIHDCYQEARRLIERNEVDEANRHLWEIADGDDPDEVGKVLSERVISAHAAIRRLHLLLH